MTRLRPPAVVIPPPSIEQMTIRTVIARTPVPTVMRTCLKRPRVLFAVVKEIIGFIGRLLDQTLPPAPFLKNPKSRGPPVRHG